MINGIISKFGLGLFFSFQVFLFINGNAGSKHGLYWYILHIIIIGILIFLYFKERLKVYLLWGSTFLSLFAVIFEFWLVSLVYNKISWNQIEPFTGIVHDYSFGGFDQATYIIVNILLPINVFIIYILLNQLRKKFFTHSFKTLKG